MKRHRTPAFVRCIRCDKSLPLSRAVKVEPAGLGYRCRVCPPSEGSQFAPRELRVSILTAGLILDAKLGSAALAQECARLLEDLAEEIANGRDHDYNIYPLTNRKGERCGHAVFIE